MNRETMIQVVRDTNSSDAKPQKKMVVLLDLYHQIDGLDLMEERRVDLRNLVLRSINRYLTLIPKQMKLKLASWLYSDVQWKEDREHWV